MYVLYICRVRATCTKYNHCNVMLMVLANGKKSTSPDERSEVINQCDTTMALADGL